MRWSWGLPFLLVACGARTELAGTTHGEAGASCTEPPWIVFDYAGGNAPGLAAVHPDGSGFHMLGIDGFVPSIAPDGRSLLYLTGSAEGEESLALRDLPSGATRTITTISVQAPSSGLGKASVSPDGKWIAYGNTPDLRLVAFDGSGDHLLVQGPYEAGCCPWSYGHPQFSADSSSLWFSTIGRLETIRLDGSGRTLLYQDHFFENPIPGFVFPNVSLSPDGTKMVAQVACDVSELRVFDATTTPFDPCASGTKLVETGLSMAYNEASNPSWGPTGLVAYDDDKDVFVVAAAGGSKTNVTASVTTNGAFAADPVWAPGCANLP